MRLQTILNRVEKFESFTYGEARLEERAGGPALVVRVRPRKNSRPYCSGCLRWGRAYDRLDERRFEFVPFRGILVSPPTGCGASTAGGAGSPSRWSPGATARIS